MPITQLVGKVARKLRSVRRGVTNVARKAAWPPPSEVLNNSFISGKVLPLDGADTGYILHRAPRDAPRPDAHSSDGLPVPPQDLWAGYCKTPEAYVKSGRDHIVTMLEILDRAAAPRAEFRKVLDFGCAAARMLRHYPRGDGGGDAGMELWGVDIDANCIAWCQQHLPPPFAFATVTTFPHLPFDDDYFDLVYCGSVFTHITDLADMTFLELRRILRPGGYLFATIHDKHSVELLLTKYQTWPVSRQIQEMDRRTRVSSEDYACFTIPGSRYYPLPQVFYDRDFLLAKWGRYARVVSVDEDAYGYQTALSFQKA